MATTLTKQNFKELVLDSDKPALVDFWAVWCGPCKMLTPTIEELAKNYEGKALIGKVNVDDERALAQEYRVMSIPTLFFFKDGKVVEQMIGARPYEEIAKASIRYRLI